MSISGISSSTNAYKNQLQQMRTDFTTLQASLSSGNLSTAQQAYVTLTQDLQNTQQTQSGQQAGGTSLVSKDLEAVGRALQSGDLTGAKTAFSTLTQDLQNAQQTQASQQTYKGHGHHHHHHGGSSQVTTDLAAVGSALQSGDVKSAQSAFATLMKDLGSSSGQNATGTSGNSTNLLGTGSTVNITV
jgi:hypothetical protein